MRIRNCLIPLIVVALIGGGIYYFRDQLPWFQPSLDASQTQQETQTESASNVSTANPSRDEAGQATKVTVNSAQLNDTYFIDALGTVKAKEQVKIIPQTSGQVVAINVKEGDRVKAGDVLMVLGGTNGRSHATVISTQVAETNLATAQKALAATVDGNAASLKAAELQLQSAQHSLDGTYTDLAIIDRNKMGLDEGYAIIQDSLDRTVEKNQQDLLKIEYGLNQLKNGIDALENSRHSVEVMRDAQLASAADETSRQKIAAEYAAKLAELDTKINDLYAQLDTAKYGYQSAMQGFGLLENQVEGQIVTTTTQRDVLDMNQVSASQKLGLDGTSSDPVKLAEVGVQAAKIKNNLQLAQAKAAVTLADLNVQLAKSQKEALWVKAPIDGIISDVTVSVGDLVSSQIAVTSVINPGAYELKVGVDAESASRIKNNSVGQVKIGGRYINVPVVSVSPLVDSTSKLVTVSLRLPKIFFRPNQTMAARIPVGTQDPPAITNLISGQAGSGENTGLGSSGTINTGVSSTITIPLDAVIIGTEEQYVYVIQNGVAVKKDIKLGNIMGSQVQVLDGLSTADQVIVDGAKDLTEGQKVQVSALS